MLSPATALMRSDTDWEASGDSTGYEQSVLWKLLFAAFDYPFNQLGIEKTFGIVNSQNIKAMEYDQKLGFKEAVRFKGMHTDGGDLVVFEMDKADCRWIRERNK